MPQQQPLHNKLNNGVAQTATHAAQIPEQAMISQLQGQQQNAMNKIKILSERGSALKLAQTAKMKTIGPENSEEE